MVLFEFQHMQEAKVGNTSQCGWYCPKGEVLEMYGDFFWVSTIIGVLTDIGGKGTRMLGVWQPPGETST